MKQLIIISLSLFTLTNASAKQNDESKSFSLKPYLEDYVALRIHVSKSYANLEYLLKYYKINPYALNEKTVTAINASKTEKQAQDALNEFTQTFKDGHFKIQKPNLNSEAEDTSSPVEIDIETDAKTACKTMGITWDKKLAF